MPTSWVRFLHSRTMEEELLKTTTYSILRRKNCGLREASTLCRIILSTHLDPQIRTLINTLIKCFLKVNSLRWQCRLLISCLMCSSTNISCKVFHKQLCRIIIKLLQGGLHQSSRMFLLNRTKLGIYLKCKRKLSIIIYLREHSAL